MMDLKCTNEVYFDRSNRLCAIFDTYSTDLIARYVERDKCLCGIEFQMN
jgi:hypothetical protein